MPHPAPITNAQAPWDALFGSLPLKQKIRLAALDLAFRTGAGFAEGYNFYRAERIAAFLDGMSPASPEFPKRFDAFTEDDVQVAPDGDDEVRRG
jgi:hypothetical protein